MKTIYLNEHQKQEALAKVRLSSNFTEQTGRPDGLTGLLRRYDKQQADVGLIDIGEKLPLRVHVQDFTILT